jgi:ribose 5-phosphate isomerase B
LNIVIASDRRGQAVKDQIVLLLRERGCRIHDVGSDMPGSNEYPELSYRAAKVVSEGQAECAILISGNGLGMSIVANKIAGIRAAVCCDSLTAQVCRSHLDTNVLCLAVDLVGIETVHDIVRSWLTTGFEDGGRHARRVHKIRWIEQGQDPELTPETPQLPADDAERERRALLAQALLMS